MRTLLLFLCLTGAIIAFVQCSDDTSKGRDVAAVVDSRSDTGAPDRQLDAAPKKDAARDLSTLKDSAGLSYTDGGCLTYTSAGKICGSGSDGSVCKFSVSCGTSSSEGQCLINCEMGSTYGHCYKASDVTCLLAAFAKKSCSDFKACNWGL